MKKIFITIFACFITFSIFAQQEYVINKTQANQTCKAYKVKYININVLQYEYKDADNPKYIEKKAEIDSIKKQIININGKMLQPEEKQFLLTAQKHLRLAIKKSKKQISAKSFTSLETGVKTLSGKWEDIKMAKYGSAYHYGTLTSGQKEKWRRATKNCDNLIKKMRELPFADKREYYDQIREDNQKGVKFSSIVDINTVSKKILGM